jgi:hypothetical protein
LFWALLDKSYKCYKACFADFKLFNYFQRGRGWLRVGEIKIKANSAQLELGLELSLSKKSKLVFKIFLKIVT